MFSQVFTSVGLVFVLLVFLSNGRVFEIYTQDHLHDLLQDTPVGNRPGVVIAFYNDTNECKQSLKNLQFDDHNLPSMQHLILAQYELSTDRKRVWHDYESHLDLAANLGIKKYISDLESSNSGTCECPILVYLPVAYANYVGDWYRNQPPINHTSLNLIHFYDTTQQNTYKNWKSWLWSKLETSIKIVSKQPFNFEVTIIPHSGRISLLPESISKNENGGESKRIFINAYESATQIKNIYIGDEIYISTNPICPHKEAEQYMLNIGGGDSDSDNDHKNIRPTSDAPNPTYNIYGIDYMRRGFGYYSDGVMGGPSIENLYTLTVLNDGRYGFDISMKRFLDIGLIKKRHSTTCMTHTRNLVIPKVLPYTNTPGFTKIKMPPGLHERLLRFFRHWYHLRTAEAWDNAGTQLNYIDVKSYMVSLDHNFKERNSIAEDVVKPILSEWAGGQELEFTAFYGIREYERNAVLRNHVDRVDTHVFSVILQVGQTDVEEPWTLEVIGFDGKYYNIELFPGEIALYEGHTLIHGRPKPFNGTLFTNCFCHFKPKDWKHTTSSVWRSQTGKDILELLHVRLQDLYR